MYTISALALVAIATGIWRDNASGEEPPPDAVEDINHQVIEHDQGRFIHGDKSIDVDDSCRLNSGRRIEITAGDLITIRAGHSAIFLQDNGDITINGGRATITIDRLFEVASGLIKLNKQTPSDLKKIVSE